jgi:hypothetical protein
VDVTVRPAGIIGDTTGPWPGRQNIFDTIGDLAAGADTNLYVLDAGYEEIRTYSPTGELLTSILLTVGKGADAIPSVDAFAVGPGGRFYLASTAGREVASLTADGVPIGEFSVPIRPLDIVVASDEFYLTGSAARGSLGARYSKEHDARDSFLKETGGPGKFVRADSLAQLAATGHGTLICSFSQPYRIVEFSPDGEILREATGRAEQSEEDDPTTEGRSSGLAVLGSGHVVNMVRNEAAGTWYADVFTPDLRFIERIQREAFGFEHYRHVTAVGSSLYLSSPDPAPHVRRFDISVE